ncbi:MAG: hypothetical protein ABSC57_07765, partial [Syntrophales bacterium]
MKTCKRCGEEFEESSGDYNPAQELGEIFLDSMGGSEGDDISARGAGRRCGLPICSGSASE